MTKPKSKSRETGKASVSGTRAKPSVGGRNPIAGKSGVGYTVHDQHKKLQDAFYAPTDEHIDDKITDKDFAGKSIAERLRLVDEYAQTHPGASISGYLRQTFPELSAIESLRTEGRSRITKAPALWDRDRLPTETPPIFLKKHYGEKIEDKQLTLGDIGRVDPKFVRVIYNWRRSNTWPTDIPLPADKDRNGQAIAELSTILGISESDPDGAKAFGHVARLAWTAKQRETRRK